MTEPLYLQDLPKGIEIRGDSVRLCFAYKSQTCRETLKGKNISKATVEFAKKKLAIIKYQIAEGAFNYLEHFPSSSRAARLSGAKDANRTIAHGLKSYLDRVKNKLAPSSFRSYRGKAMKHLAPKWGHRMIRDIQKTDIETWQLVELPGAELSDKTINIIFIVLRGIFKDAVGDQVITFNPLDLVGNLENPESEEPDPLSQKELDQLLAVKTHRTQEINLIGFNARSGLRLSEVLALAWEDIDVKTWTVRISRGRVMGEYKVPKTKDSTREFELQPEAIVYLKAQMVHTYMAAAEEVEVRQRNSRTIKTESLRFVFNNTGTGRPWSGDNVFRKTYTGILKKAGVRYRGPNQLRHTFASWLLTNLIPLEWIAPIMGTSVNMLKKHYAKMIPEDRPDIGRIIKDVLKSQREQLEEASKKEKKA